MSPSPAIPTVFVSHSHLDNAFGLRLIGDLRAQLSEAAVWYDVSGGLHGGDEWWREIVRQITAREVFLVILSPNALASDWVPREMAMAYHLHVKRGKRLLPILYRPCDLSVDWEIIHGLPCRDPRDDSKGYAMDLAAIVADILRQPAPPPPPWDPRFPKRLADLDYTKRANGSDIIILPPLCDIPAGPFLMGSDKRRDSQADDDELPQQTVTLPSFQIGRYPVTVAEYACAVRVGVRPQPPDNYGVSWGQQLERMDHPVVNVSWNDAIAYVGWLTQMTRQPWRLPTEAEWEKAARGTDGRIYPWGDAWDKTRANTADGGPGTTTPVGTYPSGASPYGAQDMAGNVWEWCSSLSNPYPYNPAVSEALDNRTGVRVFRGGSWDSNPRDARVAGRDWDLPDSSDVRWGFRLCRGAGAGTN